MNKLLSGVGNLLHNFLSTLVSELSPSIRDLLKHLLDALYLKALKTDNPIDDALCEVLYRIMGFEVPKK